MSSSRSYSDEILDEKNDVDGVIEDNSLKDKFEMNA